MNTRQVPILKFALLLASMQMIGCHSEFSQAEIEVLGIKKWRKIGQGRAQIYNLS